MQSTVNSEEFESLKKGTNLKQERKTFRLYLHTDILRVDGRSASAQTLKQAMFPMIYAQKCELAKLVVHVAHLKTLLGGAFQTLLENRTTLWIMSQLSSESYPKVYHLLQVQFYMKKHCREICTNRG